MLLPIPMLAFVMQVAKPEITVSDELAVAQAVATFELAWWRKNHPKADLSLTFSNPALTTTQANLVRTRVGYKNPIAVLDPHVLTLVLDMAKPIAPKRVSIDGFVFLGAFPKGFQARYLVRTDGKLPVVVVRTVLQRYEMKTPALERTSTPSKT